MRALSGSDVPNDVLGEFMLRFMLIFLFIFGCLEGNPWGKDADLVGWNGGSCCPKRNCRTPILGQVSEGLIRFHQEVISPADGPRSNFKPSSSQYMLDAMRKYGFFQGFIMGCDRLMRENDDPWVYRTVNVGTDCVMKYDPVP